MIVDRYVLNSRTTGRTPILTSESKIMKYYSIAALFVCLGVLFSCSRDLETESTLASISAEKNALNFLIVVTGQPDSTDIPGVHKDPGNMIEAFSAVRTQSAPSSVDPGYTTPSIESRPNNFYNAGFGSFDFAESRPESSGKHLVFQDSDASAFEQAVNDIATGNKMGQIQNQYQSNFITVSVLKATKQRILDAISMVSRVAATYDVNGALSTAMLHISSHGSSGFIETVDGEINLSQMASASQQARGGKPWRRFYFVVDACESGQLLAQVDASGAAAGDVANFGNSAGGFDFSNAFALRSTNSDDSGYARSSPLPPIPAIPNIPPIPEMQYGPQNAGNPQPRFDPMYGIQSSAKGFAHQLIVLSSSRSTESSIDESDGGAFTSAFTRAFKRMSSDPSATIKSLIDTTQEELAGMQHPVFKVTPASVCNDKLQGSDATAKDSSALSGSQLQSCGEEG